MERTQGNFRMRHRRCGPSILALALFLAFGLISACGLPKPRAELSSAPSVTLEGQLQLDSIPADLRDKVQVSVIDREGRRQSLEVLGLDSQGAFQISVPLSYLQPKLTDYEAVR